MAFDSIEGCLLGMAVGDALGLPYEGLSPQRAEKLLGKPDRFRFFRGQGMISDDTEHAVLTARALIVSGLSQEKFTQALADGLRHWFLLLPAGTGRATALACCKLLLRCPPRLSGCQSAGNGTAMRAPILGVFFAGLEENSSRLYSFVRISSRMTHRDSRAEWGALAIALATQMASEKREIAAREFLEKLQAMLAGEPAAEFLALIEQVVVSCEAGQTLEEYLSQRGLTAGVSGYVNHSIPVVLFCWLNNQQDLQRAVTAMIECGGDTDTNAALVGGIIGARVGRNGVPADWLRSLWLWPDSLDFLQRTAEQLAEVQHSGITQVPVDSSEGKTMLRNLLFLSIVLTHGFRRLLPF